jgi:hypothetical protein
MHSPDQQHRHDGKLEVRSDYVCLSTEYHNLDSLNELLDKPFAQSAYDPTKLIDVADQRPEQELLYAALRSSGSRFVFSLPTPRRAGGLYVRVVRIEETRTHLGDDVALAALLASIPFPLFVAPLLQKPFFERKWDYLKQCDHWIASDGTTVVSLTISGASAAAVARMRLRFDDRRIVSPALQPSLKILHDLLEGIAREAGRDD